MLLFNKTFNSQQMSTRICQYLSGIKPPDQAPLPDLLGEILQTEVVDGHRTIMYNFTYRCIKFLASRGSAIVPVFAYYRKLYKWKHDIQFQEFIQDYLNLIVASGPEDVRDVCHIFQTIRTGAFKSTYSPTASMALYDYETALTGFASESVTTPTPSTFRFSCSRFFEWAQQQTYWHNLAVSGLTIAEEKHIWTFAEQGLYWTKITKKFYDDFNLDVLNARAEEAARRAADAMAEVLIMEEEIAKRKAAEKAEELKAQAAKMAMKKLEKQKSIPKPKVVPPPVEPPTPEPSPPQRKPDEELELALAARAKEIEEERKRKEQEYIDSLKVSGNLGLVIQRIEATRCSPYI